MDVLNVVFKATYLYPLILPNDFMVEKCNFTGLQTDCIFTFFIQPWWCTTCKFQQRKIEMWSWNPSWWEKFRSDRKLDCTQIDSIRSWYSYCRAGLLHRFLGGSACPSSRSGTSGGCCSSTNQYNSLFPLQNLNYTDVMESGKQNILFVQSHLLGHFKVVFDFSACHFRHKTVIFAAVFANLNTLK